MRNLSTVTLIRAWLYRSMPALFEQPDESLGVDEAPLVLVADGTPADPVKVLGREHVTLQGSDISGSWAIETSLDPLAGYAAVATISADGFTTLDPGLYGYLRATGGSGGTIKEAAAK